MRRPPIMLLTVLSAICPAAFGQDAPDDLAVLSRFMRESTVAVAHVDVSRVDLKPAADKIMGFYRLLDGHVPEDELNTWRRQVNAAHALAAGWIEAFKTAGGRHVYLVVDLEAIPDPPVLVIVPAADDAKRAALGMMLTAIFAPTGFRQKQIDGHLVFGTQRALELAGTRPADRAGEARAALGAVKGAAIRAALIPPDYARRALNELAPRLPAQLGGAPISTITDGVQWAAIGVTPAPRPGLEIVVQSANETAAAALDELTMRLLALAKEQVDNASLKELLARVRPSRSGDRLTLKWTQHDIDGLINAWAAQIAGREKPKQR